MPRGGKRPGAGRKPGKGGRSLGRKNALKLAFEKGIIGVPRDSLTIEVTPPAPGIPPELDRSAFILPPGSAAARAVKAADILATVDELKLWQLLLLSSDPKVAFWALQYLMDQRDGRAKQSSDVKVTRTIENRSDEELEFFVACGQWPPAYYLGLASRAWESREGWAKTIKRKTSENLRIFKASQQAPGRDDRRTLAAVETGANHAARRLQSQRRAVRLPHPHEPRRRNQRDQQIKQSKVRRKG